MTIETKICTVIGMLLGASLYPQHCVTVQDGEFYADATWNCVCNPASCDTLIIAHTVTTTSPINLNCNFIEILDGAVLETSDTLHVNGDFEGHGHVSASEFVHTWPHRWENYGQISANQLSLYSDSTFNYGSIDATDTIYIASVGGINNYGTIHTRDFWNQGFSHNYGTINSITGASVYISNFGKIVSKNYFVVQGSISNIDTIISDTISCIGSSFDNSGYIQADSVLFSQGQGYLAANSLMRANNWTNFGTYMGTGSICIVNESMNHGHLGGAVDICDATPTGEFVDVNDGTIESGVTSCLHGNCPLVGIAEITAPAIIDIYPNPTADRCTVRVPREVQTLRLLDILGHVVATWPVASSAAGTVELTRPSCGAGQYMIRAENKNGTTIALGRVSFLLE